MSSSPPLSYTFSAKYVGSSESFEFPADSTVGKLIDHIAQIFSLSSVKLIGLTKGSSPLPPPSSPLSSLSHLKFSPVVTKLIVVGSPSTSLSSIVQTDSQWGAVKEKEEREEREREEREKIRIALAEEAERAREAERREWEAERAERAKIAEKAERERILQQRMLMNSSLPSLPSSPPDFRETLSSSSVCFRLRALPSPNSDRLDKLILPNKCLAEIVNAKVEFPITFKVTKIQTAGKSEGKEKEIPATKESPMDLSEDGDSENSKCSPSAPSPLPPPPSIYMVHDFTAPDNVLLAPRSLFSSLGIRDFDEVSLETVKLPKASFVKISAETWEWQILTEDERKALLEFHLRKLQTLRVGQRISIQYQPQHPAFEFVVREAKPSDTVSIIDAEMQTEVTVRDIRADQMEEAEREEKNGDAKKKKIAEGREDGFLHESLLSTECKREFQLDPEKSEFFSLNIPNENSVVSIQLECHEGDGDLFISLTDPNPSNNSFDWAAQSVGEKSLILSAESPAFRPGRFFIAVNAYKTHGKFTLKITEKKDTEKSVNSSSSSSSAVPSVSSPPPSSSSSSECPNCHKSIPSKSLTLHEVQCRRLTYYCAPCQMSMKTSEKSKHEERIHSPHVCGCGESFPNQSSIVSHRSSLRGNCPLRMVECPYCPLILPSRERGNHSAECGLMVQKCTQQGCGESIQRKSMRRHFQLKHNKNEREVTWKDYW